MMGKITIQRAQAYKLIEEIRGSINKAFLTGYLGECIQEEQTELNIALLGVSNGFLSEVIHTITGYNVEVCGGVEELFTCPCCGYKTF